MAVCAVAMVEAAKKKARVSQIIVLMMENRSFDHLLGYMKGVDGIPDQQTCPMDPNDPSLGSLPILPNGYDVAPDDPTHDMDHIAVQINKGAMDGFIKSQLIMSPPQNVTNPIAMFNKQSAPIINTLAEEYAVFDQWFCSLPGPTDPNRQFAMSGTSMGISTNFNGTLYVQQSYIDYLRLNGITSGGYYQDDLWQLGAYEDLVNNEENAKNIKDLDEHFYEDLKNGNLPTFTWMQPRMLPHPHKPPTWQHPDASVQEGERLIKEIYEAIRASPKWEETLFIITYDEHGGFYDHVYPPTGVPSPDGIACVDCSDQDIGTYDFTTLGVRVPTIAISPWITKGTIVSKGNGLPQANSAYESTSIMATVNELLGVDAPPMGARMAWASRFTDLITESIGLRKDCLEKLPDLPDAAADIIDVQRAKPINDHNEAQMLFFCSQNYPHEFQAGVMCPSALKHTANQGLATDWMRVEQANFLNKRQQRFENARASK